MDPEQIKQAFEERFDSSKMGTLYHLLKTQNKIFAWGELNTNQCFVKDWNVIENSGLSIPDIRKFGFKVSVPEFVNQNSAKVIYHDHLNKYSSKENWISVYIRFKLSIFLKSKQFLPKLFRILQFPAKNPEQLIKWKPSGKQLIILNQVRFAKLLKLKPPTEDKLIQNFENSGFKCMKVNRNWTVWNPLLNFNCRITEWMAFDQLQKMEKKEKQKRKKGLINWIEIEDDEQVKVKTQKIQMVIGEPNGNNWWQIIKEQNEVYEIKIQEEIPVKKEEQEMSYSDDELN